MKAPIARLAIGVSLALGWASAPMIVAGQASSSSSATAHAAHKKSAKRRAKHTPIQKAPTPDRISEIQSALARGGYYQGDPNGKWDTNTVAAMEKFQSANGMEATGKLDAPTLQKLGLGSPIAGVFAPRPVAPNCCSMAQPSGATSPNASSAASSAGISNNAAPATDPKPQQ